MYRNFDLKILLGNSRYPEDSVARVLQVPIIITNEFNPLKWLLWTNFFKRENFYPPLPPNNQLSENRILELGPWNWNSCCCTTGTTDDGFGPFDLGLTIDVEKTQLVNLRSDNGEICRVDYMKNRKIWANGIAFLGHNATLEYIWVWYIKIRRSKETYRNST